MPDRPIALTDVASKQRRYLLLASAVCLALVELDIVPTRISALGVELSASERDDLLKGALFVLLYFLIAFVSHAVGDIAEWMTTDREARRISAAELRDARAKA